MPLTFVTWCLFVSAATYTCVLHPRAGTALRSKFEKLESKSGKPEKPMSSVSEESAMKVASSLGLEWIDGNELYPIEQPADGYGVIPDFPMTNISRNPTPLQSLWSTCR